MNHKISNSMKIELNYSFTLDEIYATMMHMKDNVAPGPYGITSTFYQSFWDITRNDITKTILQILNDNKDPKDINNPLICLILKKKNLMIHTDFRLIALCNVC